MEQFVAVALAHFLALLIPGVDFFLIVRTTMTNGWRNTTGACAGIATANAIYITAAFSGIALISNPVLLDAIRLFGGGFLIVIGIAFLRSPARIDPNQSPNAERTTWLKNFGLGIASGLLNPKNALFYISLAIAIAGSPPLVLLGYGTWMVSILLAWDVLVAVLLGSRRALAGMGRVLPWLSRIAGTVLVLSGAGMLGELAVDVLR